MDAPSAYAIVGGSIAGFLFIIRHLSWLKVVQEWLLRQIIKHLVYNHILGKPRRPFGRWSIAAVFLHLGYIVANLFCTFSPAISVASVGRQSGSLILANMAFLYSSVSLSTLADLLGIIRQQCHRLHRAVGWVTGTLVAVHAGCEANHVIESSLLTAGHMASVIAAGLILTVLGTSIAIVGKWTARISFVVHRFAAVLALGAIYAHLAYLGGYPWVIYLIPAAFTLACLGECLCVLMRNGLFACWPRLTIAPLADGSKRIIISPGRPVYISPGQYVRLWNSSSTSQTGFGFRPYYVKSWEPDRQRALKLYEMPPSDEFPKPSGKVVESSLQDSEERTAFFTGPYGFRETYAEYETVVFMAYEFGILALMARLEYLYHRMQCRTSRVRRIHLIWHWSKRPLLNEKLASKLHQLMESHERADKMLARELKVPFEVLEYHLGRYMPRDDEKELLKREVKKSITFGNSEDNETLWKRNEAARKIDEHQRKTQVLDTAIEAEKCKMSIIENVFNWFSKKLSEEKTRHVNENIFDQVLRCSVYGDVGEKHRSSRRVEFVKDAPDLQAVFETELENHKKRISNDSQEARGKIVWLVSAPQETREVIRSFVCDRIMDVHLQELPYQSNLI